MNILITGANGLLGRRLAQKMAPDHTVHAVVRATPKNPVTGVQYHIIDLAQGWDFSSLPANIDVIYHLAQSENYRNFPDKALDIFAVNVDSTARLLDFAHKSSVKRFVYASSGGVYGAGSHIIHENSPITPHLQLGYYLGSKLCGEILVENYAQHMLVNIVRFFFIYGPEQKRSMLIPRLVDSVKEGKPIQLQGKGGISINPIHVVDAANAIARILDLNESATFNIAGPNIVSLKEIADTVGSLLQKEPIFESVAGDPKNIVADIHLMKSKLVAPSISLQEGIKELI